MKLWSLRLETALGPTIFAALAFARAGVPARSRRQIGPARHRPSPESAIVLLRSISPAIGSPSSRRTGVSDGHA